MFPFIKRKVVFLRITFRVHALACPLETSASWEQAKDRMSLPHSRGELASKVEYRSSQPFCSRLIRVILWIGLVFPNQKNDPRNHTNQHETLCSVPPLESL